MAIDPFVQYNSMFPSQDGNTSSSTLPTTSQYISQYGDINPFNQDNSVATADEKASEDDLAKAAKDKKTGQTTSTVLGSAAGIASAFGPIGAIVGGVLGLAGGITAGVEDAKAAKLQKKAAKEAQDAANGMTYNINPAFRQKAAADQQAANSPTPGLSQYHDILANNFANHLRAIHNNSVNGAQAVNAIATSLGFDNESYAKLFADNAQYQAGAAKTARQDLWDIGLQSEQAKENLFNNYQKPLFQQATALTNAATANKNTAIKTIVGSIGTAAVGIGSSIDKNNASNKDESTSISDSDWSKFINSYVGSTTTDATAAGTGGGSGYDADFANSALNAGYNTTSQ